MHGTPKSNFTYFRDIPGALSDNSTQFRDTHGMLEDKCHQFRDIHGRHTGRQGIRRNQLLDDLKEKEKILIIERGSTRSQSVPNAILKGFWTCRKTDCVMYCLGTP